MKLNSTMSGIQMKYASVYLHHLWHLDGRRRRRALWNYQQKFGK